MKQSTVETFVRTPVGRWACDGTILAWCVDEKLGGAVMWGRPSIDETERGLHLLDAYVALAPGAVVLLDAREVELDVDPLIDAKTWCLANRHGLGERVALQVGLSRAGVSHTFPELRAASSHPLEVFVDETAAFERAAGERAEALSREIAAHVLEVRGVRAELVTLRALLRECAGNLSVNDAATAMGMGPRALQRLLSSAQTTFRQEQAVSRSESAAEFLEGTTGTLAVVARRMGISVGTLMSTVRRSTGMRPGEYRRRARRSQR